jgi:tetratricopeptide (TPR) repeat protein
VTFPRSAGAGRAPEVWGKVPPRNKNFTGRDDLLGRLWDGISTDVTAVVPHALHGLGGVGKTQLAIEFAYRYRGEYEVVWWISADQIELVRPALAGLAPHLGLPPATATGIEDAAQAVLDALRLGRPYNKWLLIFDNADEPEDLTNLLPHGPGHVLITSRNHRWEGVVDTVAVNVFSRTESIAFLHKRIPGKLTEDDAQLLAEQLGDLPLALEQAGALQAETGMPVKEYLRLLSEHAGRLLSEGKPLEYPVSMTAAWTLSVAALTESLPEALNVLQCCAFFGPEPIPRDVFGPIPESFGTARLGDILEDPILLGKAIRELGRYALARVDAVDGTIQVHRLIQALIRDSLSPEEHERIRHEVHLLLAAAVPPRPDDTGNWGRYFELLAHVRPAQVANCTHQPIRDFALTVVRYLYSSGGYAAARTLAEELIHRWEQVSGPENSEVLVARRHLGVALLQLGRYAESYELNHQTLEMMRRIYGPDHDETLRVTNNHGADLRARGDFRAAFEHDQDSSRRHATKWGESNWRTLRTVNNLAVDCGLLSDYGTAREFHERAYRGSGRGSGVGPVDRVIWLNGLARTVRLSGQYIEAVNLNDDAYSFAVRELGAEHPWTLRAAKDLSIALRRTGQVEDGLELARDAYEREVRIFGYDHPDALAAAMNMANALRAVDQLDEALEMARDTTRRYPQIYGEDHPYNDGCAINLALLLRVHGDASTARDIDSKSLAGLTRSVGRDHHYTLTCAVNLANDLADLEEHEGAREVGEDALRRLTALLGESHPLTLACAVNLALDLRILGEHAKADGLKDEALTQYTDALGPTHPDVVVASRDHRLDFDFDPPPI